MDVAISSLVVVISSLDVAIASLVVALSSLDVAISASSRSVARSVARSVGRSAGRRRVGAQEVGISVAALEQAQNEHYQAARKP